jgi:hypothetical protein
MRQKRINEVYNALVAQGWAMPRSRPLWGQYQADQKRMKQKQIARRRRNRKLARQQNRRMRRK